MKTTIREGAAIQWRDNAGIYASAGRASEFFADIVEGDGIEAGGAEYRLSVFPAEYDKGGNRKRGAAWRIAVGKVWIPPGSCWTVERFGRDTFNDRFATPREAMRAAESVYREAKAERAPA